jgi:hypothetical protein
VFEDHDRARDEQAAARAREGRRAFEEAQRQGVAAAGAGKMRQMWG